MKGFINSLFKNSRFYILVFCFLFSLGVYFFFSPTLTSETYALIKIQQIYGLIALLLLYVALLIGPFCYTFANFPLNTQLKHARRAIGVSAFYFALLHASLGFFKQPGGFEGIGFLDTNYLIATTLGFSALLILFFLTITSVDWAIKKMQFKNWKILHRFVYFAGVAILIHALMIGSHFRDSLGPIPQITFFALAFLLVLEAPRVEKYIKNFLPIQPIGISTVITILGLTAIYFSFFSPFNTSSENAFSIHSSHKQMARETQNQQNISLNPALDGDRTLRYTVSFLKPDFILPNQETPFAFQIYNAATGGRVTLFKNFYGKPMHMILVNDELSFFRHLHPTQDKNKFIITTSLPQEGTYRTYIQFQPFNAIEQQVGFASDVGDKMTNQQTATQPLDTNLTKTFGNYDVTLDATNLNAEKMSLGEQIIRLTIKDAKTKKPITTLKPYLGSFGHMTMIKQDTYDLIHIHPADLTPAKPNEQGGPTVDFLPIGLYGKFKPGIYRMFVELNPDEKLFTADFTVGVE